MNAHEAMALIKEHRSAADPNVFYIRRRILLFARRWNLIKQTN